MKTVSVGESFGMSVSASAATNAGELTGSLPTGASACSYSAHHVCFLGHKAH